jgi:hypothetical protein
MPRVYAAASAVISAPPAVVYGLLADYRSGHPGILPERYFSDLRVEQGGVGAGTVITFTMTLFGSERSFRTEIIEPEPGRVLVERTLGGDGTTTFTVDPAGDGHSRVTIATEWTSPGLRGWVERWLAPPALRKVYAAELANLSRAAAGAQSWVAAGTPRLPADRPIAQRTKTFHNFLDAAGGQG